ncbi:hypothetical protein AB1N83_010729, partial [Pleurotus pulmonarius]
STTTKRIPSYGCPTYLSLCSGTSRRPIPLTPRTPPRSPTDPCSKIQLTIPPTYP